MDVKPMLKFATENRFGKATAAVAIGQLFLSANVASLSRGVAAMVAMRGRPSSRPLTLNSMSYTARLQVACAVSESVGPSPARHGDAMFGPRRKRKFFKRPRQHAIAQKIIAFSKCGSRRLDRG